MKISTIPAIIVDVASLLTEIAGMLRRREITLVDVWHAVWAADEFPPTEEAQAGRKF